MKNKSAVTAGRILSALLALFLCLGESFGETAQSDTRSQAAGEPAGPAEMVREGLRFLNGDKQTEKDPARAAELFKKAAEAGNADAQHLTGVCLMNGWGIKKDQARAVAFFKKAALQGHAAGQYALGRRYLRGEGVPTDSAKAVEWLRKAAEQNIGGAQILLGDCLLCGQSAEADPAGAFAWYTRAAELKTPGAAARLASCHISGRGGAEKNTARAVELLEEDAERGDSFSQETLAFGFISGCLIFKHKHTDLSVTLVERDPEKAMKHAGLRLKKDEGALTRGKLSAVMAAGRFMRGEWREALHVLADTPAKWFFIAPLAALFAELGFLFWAAWRLRKTGAGAGGPWRIGDLFTLAGLFVTLELSFCVIIFIMPFRLPVAAMIVSLLVFAACALCFAVILKLRGVLWTEAFGLRARPERKPLILWALAVPGGAGLFSLGYSLLLDILKVRPLNQIIAEFFKLQLGGFELAAAFALGVLILPALEEIVFRGIVYQSLRTKLKPWLAVPLSALIFAAVHMDLFAMAPIFVTGCVLALAFEKTKNLWVPVAAHCLNNAIAIGWILLTR
jgi:TPR repeat protein/membrane protease YdiL (CAAX protease family)